MQEIRVSVWAAVATACWSLAVGKLIVAWVLFGYGHAHLANMLGFTSVFWMGAGATLTVRCYALRTHNLIRSLHRLDSMEDERRIHSL